MAEPAAAKAEKIVRQKLSVFNWEGLDKKGKRMQGATEAISVAYVNAMLRRQGISPTKVRKQAKSIFQTKKKITPKDISIFTRQFATMVEAGIPIVQGIEIVAKGHENPSVQQLLTLVKQDIESGTTLSTALGKHKLYFDALYCNLVPDSMSCFTRVRSCCMLGFSWPLATISMPCTIGIPASTMVANWRVKIEISLGVIFFLV